MLFYRYKLLTEYPFLINRCSLYALHFGPFLVYISTHL
uniref:Uncharacterized protein n=1 Tax=Lepeophtheirus salmonis TaxID=72036 RepID=A0A0K2TS33_LEPSM